MSTVPVISESYKTFYDPNAHFMGPLTLFGTQRLTRNLLQKREKPVEVLSSNGPLPLTGSDLVAAELAHTMLIAEGDFTQANWLGLSENRLVEAVKTAEFGAQSVVRGVKSAVEVLLDENAELARLSEERDPLHLLAAGAVLAAVSHKGQKRKSGLDYVTHTIATAGIAGIAARKEGEDFSDHERHVLRLLQYGLLNHDGFEDSMESKGANRGRSFLASERIVPSPLVHYTLLQSLGVSPEESFAGARNVYMLSKPVGPERKGRMKYSKYVDRFFEFIDADVMKMCDVHDNLEIDPKRVQPINMWHRFTRNRVLRIKNQQNNYSKVFNTLEAHVAESDADPMLKRIARNIRFVKPEDLDEWRQPTVTMRILNQLDNKKLLSAWDEGQRRLAA